MKKILMVFESLDVGGVQTVIMSIVRNLYNRYIFDMVVFSNEEGLYEKEFLSYGGQIFRINHYKGKSKLISRIDFVLLQLFGKRKIQKIIRNNGPYDIVHCHKDIEGTFVIKAAYQEGVKQRIIHNHRCITKSGSLLKRFFDKFSKKELIKYSTNFVGSSSKARLLFAESSNSYITILNPYNESEFVRTNEYSSVKSLNIVQIGALNDIKNQKFSLDVMNEIVKHIENAQLVLIGKNIEDSYYDDLVLKRDMDGLNNNVVIEYKDADKVKILNRSSYMILPSKRELFGIVLVEAQSLGIKCFVSDTVPKDADCGGCIYLPLSAGPKAWADAIISDYEKTHGEHVKYDCSKFESKKIANIYRDLYEGKLNAE